MAMSMHPVPVQEADFPGLVDRRSTDTVDVPGFLEYEFEADLTCDRLTALADRYILHRPGDLFSE